MVVDLMLSQAKEVWLGRQDGLGKRSCEQHINMRLNEGQFGFSLSRS